MGRNPRQVSLVPCPTAKGKQYYNDAPDHLLWPRAVVLCGRSEEQEAPESAEVSNGRLRLPQRRSAEQTRRLGNPPDWLLWPKPAWEHSLFASLTPQSSRVSHASTAALLQFRANLPMNPEKRDFLSLGTPPARLSLTETAWFLGFSEHDLSVLISLKILKPLGHPPPSGSKYFSYVELQRLRADVAWLSKASDATVNHWKRKNAGRVRNQPACAIKALDC